MCPFMSDAYFVNFDCNFSHWTTFNSLRQLGQNETSLQPFKFVYLYVNLFVCRYLLFCLLNDSAQQHNINVVSIKQSHQFFMDLLPCNM